MDSENRVKNIAEKLDNIMAGIVYYCPECGYEHTQQPSEYDNDIQRCPECDEGMTQMTFGDYFEDNLGIEVTVDLFGHDTIKHGRICIAWGGPSIYVDTGDEEVQLFWWGNNATAPISHAVANAIDDYIQELWEIHS